MAKILGMPKLSPTMEEGVLARGQEGGRRGRRRRSDRRGRDRQGEHGLPLVDKGTLLSSSSRGAHGQARAPVAILGRPGEDVCALVASAEAAPRRRPRERAQPAESRRRAEAPTRRRSDAGRDAEARARGEGRAETRPKAPDRARARAQRHAAAATLAPASVRTAPSATARARRRPRTARVLASPYVRKIARERGIDLAGVRGQRARTGASSRAISSRSEPRRTRGAATRRARRGRRARAAAPREPEARPLSHDAQDDRAAAHRVEADRPALLPDHRRRRRARSLALREQINAELARARRERTKATKPDKISLNDLLIKAVRARRCARARVQRAVHAATRSSSTSASTSRSRSRSPTAWSRRSCATPTRRASSPSRARCATSPARARAKKLKPEEMSDGTFSISNLGMFGIDAFSRRHQPARGRDPRGRRGARRAGRAETARSCRASGWR